jgi:uncharacterized protein DUF6941
MKIEFLILADAAQVANGKLFVLGGGWGVYRSGNYPAQAQLALGVSILIGWNETGVKHPLNITIADEAGVPIIPELKGQVEAGRSEEVPQGSTQKVPLAVNLNLSIPRPGKYAIVVTAGAARSETFFDAIFVGRKAEVTTAGPGELGN